ncbi:MAG: asparagine synthase (glutamine-hydrolyzing) [Hyphomicrobiales bacterium]
MCGLAGFVKKGGSVDRQMLDAVESMSQSLQHRGPDGSGCWHDTRAVLAHRRLSIVDLTDCGHQPMVSQCGRYILVYNGEIYNHEQIREEMQGTKIAYRGRSDSETLLEAIACWGCDSLVPRLNGIFAFAVWDRKLSQLTLARDRLGVKPLYWTETPSGLAFASELRAFQALPDWQPEIDIGAVEAFLRYGNVPAPTSIFQGVYKLEPGMMLSWQAGGSPQLRRYWDPCQSMGTGLADPLTGSVDEIVKELERALLTAVERQMMSDVPIGAFLSSGVDSSLIAALMQSITDRPIQTFSIGFDQRGYDEAPVARVIAEHLGTQHNEAYATPAMLLSRLPDLINLIDEPFGDASFLPTLLLSEAARASMTVALSGDGGDELFAGYSRHVWAHKLQNFGPLAVRQGLSRALTALPASVFDGVPHLLAAGRGQIDHQFSRKAQKAVRALGASDSADLHRRLLSAYATPKSLLRHQGAKRAQTGPIDTWAARCPTDDPVATAQLLDMTVYMPDDVLTKVDRASMAASLEVRVPFLDPDLVDLAWRIPSAMKLHEGTGKWILRQILRKHLPADLVDRPKSGFTVPLAEWLRGPLREWADDLLSEKALSHDDVLEAKAIGRLLERHLSGAADNSAILWNLLIFQQWRQRWSKPQQIATTLAKPLALV